MTNMAAYMYMLPFAVSGSYYVGVHPIYQFFGFNIAVMSVGVERAHEI